MKIEIMNEKDDDGYSEHELENGLRTLLEADDLKADSKKLAAVQKFAEEKAGKIRSIADLREAGKKANREAAKEGSDYPYEESMDPYAEDRLEVMKKNS